MPQRDSALIGELLAYDRTLTLEVVAKRVGIGSSTLGLWKREAKADPEGFRLSDINREKVRAYLSGRGRELFDAAEQLERIAALLRDQGARLSEPDAGARAADKARALTDAGRTVGGKKKGKKRA